MKSMTYLIRFEDKLDLVDIAHSLKEIKSPIRLEVGDKIAIGGESFDEINPDKDINLDYINEMMEILLKKAIKASEDYAYFEISDIIYYNEDYNRPDYFFHGVIILKGK